MLWDTFIVLMLLNHMTAEIIYIYIYTYTHKVLVFHTIFTLSYYSIFCIFTIFFFIPYLFSRLNFSHFYFPDVLFTFMIHFFFFSSPTSEKNASLADQEHTITCEAYGMWPEVLLSCRIDLYIHYISFIQDSTHCASAKARMMYNRATKERLLLSLERNMLEWMRSLFHTQKPAQKDKWIMRSWTQMRKPNWLSTNNCKRLPQSRLTSDFLFFFVVVVGRGLNADRSHRLWRWWRSR